MLGAELLVIVVKRLSTAVAAIPTSAAGWGAVACTSASGDLRAPVRVEVVGLHCRASLSSILYKCPLLYRQAVWRHENVKLEGEKKAKIVEILKYTPGVF